MKIALIALAAWSASLFISGPVRAEPVQEIPVINGLPEQVACANKTGSCSGHLVKQACGANNAGVCLKSANDPRYCSCIILNAETESSDSAM